MIPADSLVHAGHLCTAPDSPGAVLLTADKDFDIYVPSHLQREWIDPMRLNRLGRK